MTTAATTKQEFVQLRLDDNWGHVTLRHPDDNGVFAPTEGDNVIVRFPDGALDVVEVVHRPESRRVNDMGTEYRVDSNVPGFKIEHHGIVVWVSFTQVEVRR